MIYTLFFSRLKPEFREDPARYVKHASRVRQLASDNHPGFLEQKTFVSEDGERLSVVTFKDASSQDAWRTDPDHRTAQAMGRTDYYEEYRVVICEEVRSHQWREKKP